jgi:hypothetical protein
MKKEEWDVPLKHSGTSYTLPAPIPRDSSSASKCQSFTYSPSPFPDSHKSRTSLSGLSVRANSPYSGVDVSATGTIWCPYTLRAVTCGFVGPPFDGVVHSVRDGQWAVDEAERRKGVLGRRCCDCFKSGGGHCWSVYTDQEIGVCEMIIYRYRSFFSFHLKYPSYNS